MSLTQTIRVETELPTTAEAVWRAMRHPASFLYVTRGMLGVPALVGRTDPLREGECGSGWILLWHVIPLWRHTIQVNAIDESSRTIRTAEHGGVVKVWKHDLHVEPAGEQRCRYSDTIEIAAGRFTRVVASLARLFYRYRQRRWRRLVRRHLLPEGPRWAAIG